MRPSATLLSLFATTLLVAVACAPAGSSRWTYSPHTSPGTAAAATATPSVTGVAQGGSMLPALTPKSQLPAVPATEVNVSYAPEVPPPSGRTTQAIVAIHFDVVEGIKAIDPNGHEYLTWGYRVHGDVSVTSGTPGPLIRARVGDVLRFTLTNLGSMPHNVDFHAVTGQGGGAKALTINPGEVATIEARLLYPGFFMYHCAAGDVPMHISAGMYGGILVDPETPLPRVEHELYVVQSEYYTATGSDGSLSTDRAAITNEQPTYVVFNGAVGSLTGDNAPHMNVGETMRIYFINAGLNLDSNFHPIGSHWDKVYQEAALLNPPLRGSQTTLVPAGGGTVVELIGQVPMTVVLVDHALARAFDKGAIGQIVIDGDTNFEIYEFFPVQPAPGATALPSPSASTAPSSSPVGGTQVSILIDSAMCPLGGGLCGYGPLELMVPIGTTVTWANDDPGMPHTVTATDTSFDSGIVQSGQSWSYTFAKAGEFEYFCTLHPGMRAAVMVEMH